MIQPLDFDAGGAVMALVEDVIDPGQRSDISTVSDAGYRSGDQFNIGAARPPWRERRLSRACDGRCATRGVLNSRNRATAWQNQTSVGVCLLFQSSSRNAEQGVAFALEAHDVRACRNYITEN